MRRYSKEQINDETCELLEPYLNAPDFNFAAAGPVRMFHFSSA